MKKIGKLLLFFSSYLIVFLVLLIKETSRLPKVEFNIPYLWSNLATITGTGLYTILVILAIIAVVIFGKSYQYPRLRSEITINLVSVSNGTSEVISYLLTMVIPLIGSGALPAISVNEWASIVSILLIAIVILLIYTNSNLVVVNPTLCMFGWSLYKIQYQNLEGILLEGILISAKPPSIKELRRSLSVGEIDDGVFIYRSTQHGTNKN